MEEDDLGNLLPQEMFRHPDCLNNLSYERWEREVATPALEALGFKVGDWSTLDYNSFGPLLRGVELTRDGETATYYYGT